VFISQVKIDGKPAGKGKGKTKKEAEQMAAKETIKTLENK
jgi:ribonuclease-3